MAVTVSYIKGRGVSSGRNYMISVYNAANAAVGSLLPINRNGDAASTSPTHTKFGEDVQLYGCIAGPATGVFRLQANGEPTGATIVNAAQQAANVREPLNIICRAGDEIRFEVTSVFPA